MYKFMIVVTTILLAISTVDARDPRQLGPAAAKRVAADDFLQDYIRNFQSSEAPSQQRKQVVQNNITQGFAVDGRKIPEVHFDVGESYAGTIPINAQNNSRLYFWYFPTTNPEGKNDLTIWLNGGPGCSSLEGFLQENGPFLWNYGTFRPVKNPWAWNRLTNMLWVDQPVGTGFSNGVETEFTDEQAARSFVSWFRNFVDTFQLHGKKIYVTGESYAGHYVPWIADMMLNAKDKRYFDLRGTMIYDGSINSDTVMSNVPLVPYVKANKDIFRFNDTYMATIERTAKSCGYSDYINTWLTYPPRGIMPQIRLSNNLYERLQCMQFWSSVKTAAMIGNPCFNQYHITTSCPLLWDVLGFPGSFEYLPEGAQVYFDRPDVKKAINAPIDRQWKECNDVPLFFSDRAISTSWNILPRVIERSERTILGHGSLDFILLANGTLLSIQNMTWHGQQGFQRRPKDDFFVPYHREESMSTMSGSGIQGITHTERNLTYVEVFLSGHMVPQYTPSSSFRHMEYLLGRIHSLSEISPFTTQRNIAQPRGKGRGGTRP